MRAERSPAAGRSALSGTAAHMHATSQVARSRLTSMSTPSWAVTAVSITGVVILRRVVLRPRAGARAPRRAASCSPRASRPNGS